MAIVLGPSLPRGLCETDWCLAAKILSPHCLEAIFDSQLPSQPNCLLKCLPNCLSPNHRSLGNGVRKNGVRNRCPYRRCGVDTELPYRPFSLVLCRGESVEAVFSHWFWRHTGLILNFRIGFLSSTGGRLPYPCLPTPFPILRYQRFTYGVVREGVIAENVSAGPFPKKYLSKGYVLYFLDGSNTALVIGF